MPELTKVEWDMIRHALFMQLDEVRREMKYVQGGYTRANKEKHRAILDLLEKIKGDEDA